VEFRDEFERAKAINLELRSRLVLAAGEVLPVSIFDGPTEGFEADISKLHKRIMEERDEFRSRDLSQRAASLPITDPRRMAFYANTKDRFSKSLYSSLPVPSIRFTNTQWSTTNALHFGVPIPALRAHVGKHLQSGSRRGGPYTVDAHGLNLLTAPALRGGHIQRNHNGICSTISDGLREARIPYLGGGTARSCKGIFRNACPAMTDEDADIVLNGMIPDLIIQTGQHSPDEHSLAGCEHLADTKTLNASKQHYHKKSADFGFAVKQRQTEVKSEYRKKAEKLDAKYHQPGDATTFKSILNEYGKGGEMLGLVAGYSGEASSDVHRVADLVATR
jgi:hypothetical protein